MELTQEIVDRYVGGQLEVQNRNEGYLYRGEVSAVKLTGDTKETQNLKVNFAWWAQMGEDFEWEGRFPEPYSVGLMIYSVSEIGEERLMLSCPYTGEMAVFYKPDGSKLDPEKIKDLVRV